jgi:hypothetical protein
MSSAKTSLAAALAVLVPVVLSCRCGPSVPPGQKVETDASNYTYLPEKLEKNLIEEPDGLYKIRIPASMTFNQKARYRLLILQDESLLNLGTFADRAEPAAENLELIALQAGTFLPSEGDRLSHVTVKGENIFPDNKDRRFLVLRNWSSEAGEEHVVLDSEIVEPLPPATPNGP